MKQLFRKKSIASYKEASAKTTHKKTLGSKQLILFGLGAIIGAGIFVITGEAAANYAGPGVILSFLFAAMICVLAAFCYAEFASMVPVSGSAYTYAYLTLGELPAWIMGWTLMLEFLFSSATVAVGFSSYVVSFLKDFGIEFSGSFTGSPLVYDVVQGWSTTGSYLNLPAVLLVIAIGVLLTIGIRAAALFNNVMVIIKLALILLFVGMGLFYVKWENLTPLIPQNTGVFGSFGISGILRAAGLIFFAYIGFDSLSTLVADCKNPQKDMPRGMIGSLLISTVVYMVIASVIIGLVPYQLLGVADPISVCVTAFGPNLWWVGTVLKIAIIAALCSVALVMLMGQSKIFHTIATDGLFPSAMKKLHSKFKTPVVSVWVMTFIAALACGFLPVTILGQLVSMGTLLAFGIVCVGVLILRKTEPKLPRPFKTPFVPYIPLLGAGACLFQMLILPLVTWVQMLGFMAIGVLFYFAYGRKHSTLARK